jgi:hypothetical protein
MALAQVAAAAISGYSAETITVRLPFTSSSGSSQLRNYYVPSSTKFLAHTDSDTTSADADEPGISTTAPETASKATSNQFSVTPTTPLPLTTHFFVGVSFYNADGSDAAQDNIVAPYAAKNKATRYESWMIITKSSSTTYVMSDQFALAATASVLTTANVCGNVAKITFDPALTYSISSTGKTFYLEYTAAALTLAATGVASGAAYPAYKSAYSGSLKTTLTGGLITNDITSLDASTNLVFYTSIPTTAFSAATYYYIDDSERSDEKFVITADTDGHTLTVTGGTNTDILGAAVPVAVSSSATTITTASLNLAADTTSEELSVQLPVGFTFTSNTITGSVAGAITGNAIYDSTNMYFKFPALVAGASAYAAQTLAISARAYWVSTTAINVSLSKIG